MACVWAAEEQGLVERDRSGPDRHVVTARLTPAGAEVITEVFPGHAAFINGLTTHLTRTEKSELRALLKKLGRGLSETE